MSLLRPALTAILTAAVPTMMACTSASTPTAKAEESPASSPAATSTSTPEASPSSPIDGTWRAGPHRFTRVVRTLDGLDLGQHATTVLEGQVASSSYVFDLKLQNGSQLLTASVDGEPVGVQDRGAFEVDGRTVDFSPVGLGCSVTLRWSLTGDTLRLVPQRDTCPRVHGAPDLAFIVKLYGSAPFERVAP